MTTSLERTADLLDIALLILVRSQKVKHRAIMPDINTCLRQPDLQHIGLKPADIAGVRTQPLSRPFERSARQIQHRKFAVTLHKEIINETGGTSASVNNRRFA